MSSSRRTRIRRRRNPEDAAATPGPSDAGDSLDEADRADRAAQSDPSAEDESLLAPLLTLRDGLPEVVDTPEALTAACAALAAGSGPVAIDAERASGYRYSGRAYLIQLRREGAGTYLIDPIPFGSELPQLQEALADVEWILHAATQDLACLREVGLVPRSIFDTELAGRLLGYPKVGLATLVEELLGLRMRKEHSAADWSTRPLPSSWISYAALDVEVLLELREHMITALAEQGKTQWAAEEFTALLDFAPAVRAEAWRRTSGTHRLRGRRGLAAVRALWETRDAIARDRDVTPGRIIPDSAIIAAVTAMPKDKQTLLSTPGFHGRGAGRYAAEWLAAIAAAEALPEAELPERAPRSDGPPHPRMWADRDPVAARRLSLARAGLAELSEQWSTPVENLLTPDLMRRLLWQPPASRDPAQLTEEVGRQLSSYGARPWQVALTQETLVSAIITADDPEAVAELEPTAVEE